METDIFDPTALVARLIKSEANKVARKLEAESGTTHSVLAKAKSRSGETAREQEAGHRYLTMQAADQYLTMATALWAVAALKAVPPERLISTVSAQSRHTFPHALDEAERAIATLKAEWSKVAAH